MSISGSHSAQRLGIEVVPVTPIEQNCSVLFDRESKDAVIIDPGGDVDRIAAVVTRYGLNVSEIWLTHSHFDHCGGVAAALKRLAVETNPKVALLGHPNEQEFRERVNEIVTAYGLAGMGMESCPEPSKPLRGGERLAIGGHQAQVLFVPGHSPGHLCFYFAKEKVLIAGDTLFAGSIGRTDLPGGDHEQLLEAIRRELLTLPDDVVVYPGHGPTTTIGRERRANPYVQE